MNQPLLTIAIPTYNGSKTIGDMLDLLLPQITNEVELIISDNASTDTTCDIINNYIKKGYAINYLYNSTNIGPDANFLKCLLAGNGKYVWLLSDDDIAIENSVRNILNYIKNNQDVDLIYLTTRDFRGKYICIEDCEVHEPEVLEDLVTNDKKKFIKYAGYYWGFMSSFICKRENVININCPEAFFGTYWLQSYIHALCCVRKGVRLGVVKGPCVGAGIYVNVPNYNSITVNGLYYKQLIDFMITVAGFDKKQLYNLYSKRLCHLLRHDIIKSKALGSRKVSFLEVFLNTYTMIEAWFTIYPLFLFPDFLCKVAIEYYRNSKNMKKDINVNRV